MGSSKKRAESSSSSDSSDSGSASSDSSQSEKQKSSKFSKKKSHSSKIEEKEVPKRPEITRSKKRDYSPDKVDENRSHKKSKDQHVEGGDREHFNREDNRQRRRPSSPSGDTSRDHRNTRDDNMNRRGDHGRDRGRVDNRRDRGEDRFRDRNVERSRGGDNRRDETNRDFRNRRDERNHPNRNRENYRTNRDNRRRRSRSGSFDHSNAKWGRQDDNQEKKDEKNNKEPGEKQKPNFGLSGKLTEETNTYRGVVIKYSEPPEARKPKRRWRLYPFKGDKALQTLYIHRESAYLIGRDRKVVDLPVDHPSCSKQHAALQYRLVPFTRDDGSSGKKVRPYLIDLESANGTFINNKKIDSKKYVELLEKDVVKFGFSSREYVLLHENSKDEAQDDDVKQEEEEKEEVKLKEEAN